MINEEYEKEYDRIHNIPKPRPIGERIEFTEEEKKKNRETLERLIKETVIKKRSTNGVRETERNTNEFEHLRELSDNLFEEE